MIVQFCLLFSSTNDRDDDDLAEIRKCIRMLAEKVGSLLKHREELLDKYSRIEATNEQLRKELEEKTDQVKTYYNKHQLEKQVTVCLHYVSNICSVVPLFSEPRRMNASCSLYSMDGLCCAAYITSHVFMALAPRPLSCWKFLILDLAFGGWKIFYFETYLLPMIIFCRQIRKRFLLVV